MKLKQLFLGFISLSLILVSCTKDDVYTPKQESVTETMSVTTMSTMSTTSVETPKAYIFVEPQSKLTMIVNYLKTRPRSVQTPTNTPFYGFFTGLPIKSTNYTDLLNYIDMPYWYNGTLPAVIQSEIPQSTGGLDAFGNQKVAYNFSTIKINKGTLNEFGWVTVLIPTSGMLNDTKKQNKIAYYSKNGNVITSSGNNTQTIFNTNSTLYSYVLNYTGTRIPKGLYRVYSTYGGTQMRVKFNTTNDVYFRGASN
jgi:hypothetical protein